MGCVRSHSEEVGKHLIFPSLTASCNLVNRKNAVLLAKGSFFPVIKTVVRYLIL